MRFLLFFLISMFFLPLMGCEFIQGGSALALLDEAREKAGDVSDATLGKAHEALDAYCEKVPKAARLALRRSLVTDKGNNIEAHCGADSAAQRPMGKEVAGLAGRTGRAETSRR